MDIIVDLDGTLADTSHRQQFVTSKPKNWKAFFEAMFDDTPIKSVVELVRSLSLDQNNKIILCSGRPDDYKLATLTWLDDWNIPYDAIYMRKAGDFRPDDVVKEEILNQIFLDGFNPGLAIDDRLKVCRMWQRNGIPVLAVNGGNDF